MDTLDDLMAEIRANALREDDDPHPAVGGRRRSRDVRSAHRRPPNRVFLLGCSGLLALLATVAVLGRIGDRQVAVAPDPTHPAVSTAPSANLRATLAPSQWKSVIERLDRFRGRALVQRDATMLRQVDAVGSAALSSDTRLIDSLLRRRAHVRSLPLHVFSVVEQFVTVGEEPARAMLIVTDTMGAYDLLADDGSVLRHVPARDRRTWKVELQRSSRRGWVYVSAVSAGSA